MVIHSLVIICPLTEGAFVKVIERSDHSGVLRFHDGSCKAEFEAYCGVESQ